MHVPEFSTGVQQQVVGILQTGTQGYPLYNSGTNNTKPSEWDYMSSDGGTDSVAAFTWEGMMIQLHSATVAADFVVDIGSDINTLGQNVFNLVEDLRFPSLKEAGDRGISVYVPVHVPKGTRLRQRCSASTGTASAQISIIGFSRGLNGEPGYSRCMPLFTSSSSRGVAIDPGGTADTKGSYTQLIASTSWNVAAMIGIVGHNGDIARAANARMNLDIARGSSGNESNILSDWSLAWGTTRDTPDACVIPCFPVNLPKGSRVTARAKCSLNTAGDRTIDLGLYGLIQ